MAQGNHRKLAIAIATAYIADIVFNMVYHGQIMMDRYTSVAELWRTPAEMQLNAGYCFLGHLILVAISGVIFAKGYEGKGNSEGLRFGMLIGLILVSQTLIAYAYMPLPDFIFTAWIASNLLEGAVIGSTLALVYGMKLDDEKPKKAKKTKKK